MKNLSQFNPSNKPVCSVCIANYNGIKFIDNCIKSICDQSCLFNVEIIIHDDASIDGSAEYIRNNYPFVKLMQSKQNVGFCISNNRMAKEAKGDFLLLLNNDAILFPDALESLYNYSQNHDHNCILGLPQYNAETNELIDIGSTFDFFLNAVPNKDIHHSDIGMVIGACLWISKSLWDDIGGFPEWFHTLAEDMYLCCMVRLKGFGVEVIPYSGFYHWVGTSIGGGKILKNRLSTLIPRRALSERNKSYVMFLCYPSPLFHLLFSAHILLLLIEGILLSFIKRDSNLLFAIYLFTIKSLWRKRDFLIRLRKKYQKQRSVRAYYFFKPFNVIPYKLQMLIKYGIPDIKQR